MIFNKANNGVAEIHAASGTFYKNNEWTKIRSNVVIETDSVVRLISQAVYDRAEDYYKSTTGEPPVDVYNPEGDAVDDKLVLLIQQAIAGLAVFRYNQENIVSHEDAGRRFKVDNENEKMPWEWMYDRDDAAMLRKAYLSIDVLLRFLETNKEDITEWGSSDERTKCRSLLIATCKEFNEVYPIDESERFFYTLTPFIKEAQTRFLPDAMGTAYDTLLTQYAAGTVSDKVLLEKVQRYIPLRTIEIACSRLALSVFPEGVTQQFLSESQGRKASKAATNEAMRNYAYRIKQDADIALNEIKKHIQTISAGDLDYPIIPSNDVENKFVQL